MVNSKFLYELGKFASVQVIDSCIVALAKEDNERDKKLMLNPNIRNAKDEKHINMKFLICIQQA